MNIINLLIYLRMTLIVRNIKGIDRSTFQRVKQTIAGTVHWNSVALSVCYVTLLAFDKAVIERVYNDRWRTYFLFQQTFTKNLTCGSLFLRLSEIKVFFHLANKMLYDMMKNLINGMIWLEYKVSYRKKLVVEFIREEP